MPDGSSTAHLYQPKLYKDHELKDMLSETHDYAAWTGRTVELDSLIKQDAPAAEHFEADELRRRQFAAGWSMPCSTSHRASSG